MGYSIRPDEINTNITGKVNAANENIKAEIKNFNTQIELIANGETWLGPSAVKNVDLLVGIHKALCDAYSKFVTDLQAAYSNCENNLSSLFENNRGNSISFGSIAALDYAKPNVASLAYDGEKGNAGVLEGTIQPLRSAKENIEKEYNNIKKIFQDNVGPVAGIFDTSDMSSDPAKALADSVIGAIPSFTNYCSTDLESIIKDIETAVKNLKGF